MKTLYHTTFTLSFLILFRFSSLAMPLNATMPSTLPSLNLMQQVSPDNEITGKQGLAVFAGNDTTYCANSAGVNFTLAPNARIEGGVPPFSITWETTIEYFTGLLYASSFLVDTTLLHPEIKGYSRPNEWLTFIIHVTDSIGDQASDTIKIRFSVYYYLTGIYQHYTLSMGDSVKVNALDAMAAGGIPPVKFSYWTPADGLLDPYSQSTWLKPKQHAQYTYYGPVFTDSTGCVSAQTYAFGVTVVNRDEHWATEGSKWYYSLHESPDHEGEGYIFFETIKDTVINNKPAQEIRKTSFVSGGKNKTNEYEYTYREDGKVYFLHKGEFRMLYDFYAKPGDVWQVWDHTGLANHCGLPEEGAVVVDSIGLINNFGHILKVVYTSPYGNSTMGFGGKIVENAGSTGYMFPLPQICNESLLLKPGYLRCYFDKNIMTLLTEHFIASKKCDMIIPGTSINKLPLSNFKLYPNPVGQYLYIESPNSISLETSGFINIFSIQGEKFGSFRLAPQVYVGHLPQGFYIYEIVTANSRFSGKFIRH